MALTYSESLFDCAFTCFPIAVSEQKTIGLCTKTIMVISLKEVKYSFIHSFGHFYSAPSRHLLLRGAPGYSTDTVSELHAEAHRQLHVKDLPKVLTWRLERESNSRPSG